MKKPIMIKRQMAPLLQDEAQKFPVVALLGPRQSGKTTLARAVFEKHAYVSLEEPANRLAAIADPRKFLRDYVGNVGVIIDEAQRAPELCSYIQTYVDEHKKNGRIILTGSQNFLLMQTISQTLAGRISLNTLLPLSCAELHRAHLLSDNVDDVILHGFYPRIFAEKISPERWYPRYVDTYLERDIRLLQNIVDLNAFQRFIKLCAGRIGQVLNIASLANDCGISVNTAKGWLSLLETSYITFFLYPHYKNFSKRLIKSPKLYFYDTGLACNLLDIETVDQLKRHYLRGGLFECMVISNLIKQSYNIGRRAGCYFWRDHTGHEVDCVIEKGEQLFPIEIKAGLTLSPDFFDGLKFWNDIAHAKPGNSFLVCAGGPQKTWQEINIVDWRSCGKIVDYIHDNQRSAKTVFDEWR